MQREAGRETSSKRRFRDLFEPRVQNQTHFGAWIPWLYFQEIARSRTRGKAVLKMITSSISYSGSCMLSMTRSMERGHPITLAELPESCSRFRAKLRLKQFPFGAKCGTLSLVSVRNGWQQTLDFGRIIPFYPEMSRQNWDVF